MPLWTVLNRPLPCGRCNRRIRAGEPALKLSFRRAPHVALWRCIDCAGAPPPDVVAAAESDAVALASAPLWTRLAAIARNALPDWKTQQTGDDDA